MTTKKKSSELGYTCPVCGYPGAVEDQGELGVLVRHPGRDWPCRPNRPKAWPTPREAEE